MRTASLTHSPWFAALLRGSENTVLNQRYRRAHSLSGWPALTSEPIPSATCQGYCFSMNNEPNARIRFYFLGSIAFVAVALLIGTPCSAQQAPVGVRYSQTALKALHVIEAAAPNESTADASTAQQAINLVQSIATTAEERRLSTILQQTYESKMRDNNVIAAYQRVIEIEGFQDDSDTRQVRNRKDYAASELTDTIAAIQSRQDRCFRQLEKSLSERSFQNVSVCAAGVQ